MDPPPSTSLQEKPRKKKKKSKDTDKVNKNNGTVVTTGHGKNEGTNPNWAYKPPTGAVPIHGEDSDDVEFGDFDWDTVKNDDDLELWLVRVPEGVKLKYLETAAIAQPSSSTTGLMGSVSRKNGASYDVWSVGDEDEQPVGGEEIRGLSCLLPRKKKGVKLLIAPKPIARRVVISAPPARPTLDPSSMVTVHQNPPRVSYPKELLKHAFLPNGAPLAASKPVVDGMDIDPPQLGEQLKTQPQTTDVPTSGKKVKEGKGQKRKVDGESPKKSKKAKTSS